MPENIVIRGARMNNLKNIDLTIPRDKLVVMTGLSGSGKSSLAFDTLHAEGHRRFVESLSSYAPLSPHHAPRTGRVFSPFGEPAVRGVGGLWGAASECEPQP